MQEAEYETHTLLHDNRLTLNTENFKLKYYLLHTLRNENLLHLLLERKYY
jgi:hypothetical protein